MQVSRGRGLLRAIRRAGDGDRRADRLGGSIRVLSRRELRPVYLRTRSRTT